jgi:hypothetical protein
MFARWDRRHWGGLPSVGIAVVNGRAVTGNRVATAIVIFAVSGLRAVTVIAGRIHTGISISGPPRISGGSQTTDDGSCDQSAGEGRPKSASGFCRARRSNRCQCERTHAHQNNSWFFHDTVLLLLMSRLTNASREGTFSLLALFVENGRIFADSLHRTWQAKARRRHNESAFCRHFHRTD